MGRTRKPLGAQAGNLTIKQQQQRKAEEAMITMEDDKLGEPLEWLCDVAKSEWRRIVPILNEIGIVSSLDQAHVMVYCNAFAGYVEASKELERLNDEDYGAAQRALARVQSIYSSEMRKSASLCGLTIDSRLKAAATKREEIETEEQRIIRERFGNI